MQLLLALGLILANNQAPEGPRPGVQDDREVIIRLIRDLGAAKFVTRESATHALWKLGPAAEDALIEATGSPDREVVARAGLILERFRFGIFPDTGPAIVALIERYRTGDEAARRESISQLIAAGQVDTIKRFIRLAEPGGPRDQVCDWVLGRFDQTLRPLIESDREVMARDLLLAAANEPEDYAICARMLMLRGELDETVVAISRELDEEPTERLRGLLVCLQRAQGDVEGALTTAIDLPDSQDLQRNLLISDRQWLRLSDRYEQNEKRPANEPIASDRAQIESLGFEAVTHHLAQRPERRDQTLAEIDKLTEEVPTLLLFAAEAKFAIDRFDDAIALLTRRAVADGFRLLAGQHRYDEAFALLCDDGEVQTIDQWLKSVLIEENLKNPDGRVQLYLSIDVVGQLNSLGMQKQAVKYFEDLARVALSDTNPQLDLLRETCRRLMDIGQEEKAYEYIHTAFHDTRMSSSPAQQSDFGIRCVAPREYVLGSYWWRALAESHPDSLERLKVIRRLLTVPIRSEDDRQFARAILSAEALRLEKVNEARRQREQSMFADTCRRLGEREMAYEHYRYAFEIEDRVSAMRLADMYREDQEWAEAALWYDLAWQNNPAQTEALYLAGQSRSQSGDTETGQQQCQLAVRLSLTSSRLLQLAQAVRGRDQPDVAMQWYDWLIATSEPMGQAYSDACNGLGNLIHVTDPVRAADAWEQVFVGVQKQERNFVNLSGYLTMSQLIHHARATDSLARGDLDTAVARVKLCQQASPGNTDIVEEFVPGFTTQGAPQQADEVFARMRTLHLAILERYPDSALHHNNLAWGSARCHRELPEALKHAQRAVQLVPDSSSYLDTLAEVNFRLGNVEEAIDLVRRCMEIEPDKVHYREQLERFQAAKTDPAPSED